MVFIVWLLGRLLQSQQSRSFRFSEIEPSSNWKHVRTVKTKIKGVTYRGAQKIIRAKCHAGDALALVREPDNPVDLNAIQVCRLVNTKGRSQLAEQLGYISKDLAAEFAPEMDNSARAIAKIITLTGDYSGQQHRSVGVNIEIEIYSPVNAPSPVAVDRSKQVTLEK